MPAGPKASTGLKQYQRPKAGETFKEVFQHVLLNNAGIAMTCLPYSKERMDHELEQSRRLEGTAGEAASGLLQGRPEEGNTPGSYAIVQDGVPVTGEPNGSAAVLGQLSRGSVVEVLEVVRCTDDKRLRGRIEHPAGWIPIVSKDGTQRWAQKQAMGKWSDNAEELQRLVSQLGPRNANLSSESFVKPFFRHLLLPELNLKILDEDVAKFSRLTFLDVSRNPLVAINHLPPGLKFLKAYNTQITKICCRPVPSLNFLGLGHCPIGMDGLEQAASCFGNLLSIDLSYTQVKSLEEVTRHLGPLSKLRQLCLAGSPVCLLPFYRLKVLRWLPELQVIDGANVTDEESSDAQLLATAAPLGPRPPPLRLALQPVALTSMRVPLAPAAEDVLAARRVVWGEAAVAAEAAAAAAGAAGDEAAEAERASKARAIRRTAENWGKEQDAILEACRGGILRLRFELPTGAWAETSEVALDPEGLEAGAGADEAGAEPFDSFDLSKLCNKEGEPLVIEVDVSEMGEAGEDGLLQLCRWIRKGIAVKVCLRPARPPDPEEADEEAAAAGKGGKGNGRASPAKGKAPPPKAKDSPSETPQPDDQAEQGPLPEEVAVGGGVVALDTFFWRTQTGVTQEIREAGVLPALPEPWVYEVQGARVVPMSQWLEPEVQVPLAKPPPKRGSQGPAASLGLKVVLYAREQQEEEAAPVEAPTPKAAAKGKAKK